MGWTHTDPDQNAIHDDVAGEIAALTEKVSPGAGDWLVIEDANDSNNKKKVDVDNLPSGGGGGGTTPKWLDYLNGRLTGETSHSDDDFFTDATKSGLTEVAISGSATWTETRDRLSVSYSGQTAGDVAAALTSITSPSAPMTIETAVEWWPPQSDFFSLGLIFTDGTTGSDNAAVFRYIHQNDNRLFKSAGTLTNYTGSTNVSIGTRPAHVQGLLYMRLVWTAANTFEGAVSMDGVNWIDAGFGSLSHTMTPTHYGFFVSAQGGSGTGLAAFHYRRTAAADLSA